VRILCIPSFSIADTFRYILDSPGLYDMLKTKTSATEIWQSIHSRITVALKEIWSYVHDVLCNDAPEGHVPDELEEDVSLTTKDILSYSWRALKEAR
jgi:putative death-receptor fusion protein DUF2428